jgi:hypothetical protein
VRENAREYKHFMQERIAQNYIPELLAIAALVWVVVPFEPAHAPSDMLGYYFPMTEIKMNILHILLIA